MIIGATISPDLEYFKWAPRNVYQWKLNQNTTTILQENHFEKWRLQNGGHFVLGLICKVALSKYRTWQNPRWYRLFHGLFAQP